MNTLAEREGFEPSIRRKPYNALAGRPLRPLGHLSGSLFLLLLLDIPRWEGSPPVAAGGAKCARLLSSRAQSALGHSGISPGICTALGTTSTEIIAQSPPLQTRFERIRD